MNGPHKHPFGGSSLIAVVLVFTGREEGVLASVVAGLIMAGFIVVEVVMLKQGISWTLDLYFGLGLLIVFPGHLPLDG